MSTPEPADTRESMAQQIRDLRGVITRQATELDAHRAPDVTRGLTHRLRAHQAITADEARALALLLEQVAHAHRYIKEHGTEHPIEAVLYREIRDVYVGWQHVLAPSPPSEDTPAPLVWQEGDTIPADVQSVYGKRDQHFRQAAPQGRGPDGWWNPSTGVISELRLLSEHGPVSAEVPATGEQTP